MSGTRSFRSRLVDLLCLLVHRSGLLRLGLAITRARGGGATRVLCYHRVSRGGRVDELTPRRFRAHLAHLRRHYRLLRADAVADALASGEDPPRGGVVLTFDDGYRGLLEEAVPALEEAGVPAAFFVLTADLPGPGRLWLDRLAGTPLAARRRELAAMPAAEREARLDAAPDAPSDRRLLDAEEIGRLARAGFSVGSHGRTHARLPALPPEEARAEIEGSREDLERSTGAAPALFAYPWGEVSGGVREAVAAAGYRGAFTTAGGAVRPGTDPLRIPRIHVPGNASVSRLACEAAGLVGWLRGRR